MNAERRVVLTSVFLTFLAIAISLVLWYTVKESTDEKLMVLAQESQERISGLEIELKGQLAVMNRLVTSLQEEYTKRMEALRKTIERQQRESREKISALQEELKGISIEAGDFSVIVEDTLRGVVSVVTDRSQGSGIIMSEDGYIATNAHVLEDATRVVIVTFQKEIYPAQVIGVENRNDVAVLKADVSGLHNLNFADSDSVKIGEKVVALGNPGGFGFTVTEGIISQKDRVIGGSVGLLQTDVSSNPGNSGGPLINTQGKVIGMMRLKVKGFEGLGFAIPSKYVAQVYKEIKERYEQQLASQQQP